MEILKQLQEELNGIEKIKTENSNLKADKKRMSETLYSIMMEQYRELDYETKIEKFKKEWCKCCRFKGCELELPDDIGLPIKSENDWIPSTKGCKEFEWD